MNKQNKVGIAALGALMYCIPSISAASNSHPDLDNAVYNGKNIAGVTLESCSSDGTKLNTQFMLIADSTAMNALPEGQKQEVLDTAAEHLRQEWGDASIGLSIPQILADYERYRQEGSTHGMPDLQFIARTTLEAARGKAASIYERTLKKTGITVLTDPFSAQLAFAVNGNGSLTECEIEEGARITAIEYKLEEGGTSGLALAP